MNHLPNGSLAIGAPGSEMRLQAELEDSTKGCSCVQFWDAYFNLARYHEHCGMPEHHARAAVDLLLKAKGWNEP